MEIDGIRESDAAVLAGRSAGGPKLSIRGRRSDTWLKANIDNPFRHWEDEYPKKVASAASSAYRKALAAVDKLPPEASPDAAREVMETFMAAFNRVNEKHDLDTIMREEVGEVFYELGSGCPHQSTGELRTAGLMSSGILTWLRLVGRPDWVVHDPD